MTGVATTESSPTSRLTWSPPDDLSADTVASLMGPGAPFELRSSDSKGFDCAEFVRQPSDLRAMFDATAQRRPDAVFMVDGERSWTVTSALSDIDAIADLLREEYGIGPGDRVAFVAANSAEYGLALWAVLTLGAIVTGLNGWWTSTELAYGIELTEPRLILGDRRRLERLGEAVTLPTVDTVELETLLESAASRTPTSPERTLPQISPDDPAVIVFTSGTTGRPKGATLSHRNIINSVWSNLLKATLAAAGAPNPPVPGRQSASILSSPMFHISGLVGILMTGPAMGVKLVFAPAGRWDATRHLEITVEHGVTMGSGVPTQFWRLLRHPELENFDLDSVTSVGGGGAPFPAKLGREFARRMPQATLGQGYGMSETVGLGTRIGGQTMSDHPDSVGVAAPTVEVEIRDPLGDLVDAGQIGEIHLRSPSVFLGYWNNPEATRDAIDADGWYRTGDFGRIHDGKLYAESRMRDLILRGGENIYPIEIENRLVEHADIIDAAVIGVDHEELGQEVKAFVVARSGSGLSVQDVQEWVARTLARFKVPAHVEFRAGLPYTDTGKVLKSQLDGPSII